TGGGAPSSRRFHRRAGRGRSEVVSDTCEPAPGASGRLTQGWRHRKGELAVLSAQAVVAVSTGLSSVVTARSLGPAGRGQFSALMAVMAVATSVGLVGSPN